MVEEGTGRHLTQIASSCSHGAGVILMRFKPQRHFFQRSLTRVCVINWRAMRQILGPLPPSVTGTERAQINRKQARNAARRVHVGVAAAARKLSPCASRGGVFPVAPRAPGPGPSILSSVAGHARVIPPRGPHVWVGASTCRPPIGPRRLPGCPARVGPRAASLQRSSQQSPPAAASP